MTETTLLISTQGVVSYLHKMATIVRGDTAIYARKLDSHPTQRLFFRINRAQLFARIKNIIIILLPKGNLAKCDVKVCGLNVEYRSMEREEESEICIECISRFRYSDRVLIRAIFSFTL